MNEQKMEKNPEFRKTNSKFNNIMCTVYKQK